MKRLVCALALCLGLALAGPAAAASPAGYLVDMQGQRIEVAEFINLMDTFFCQYQDTELRLPLSEVKSLTRLADGDSLELTTTKGERFVVMGPLAVGQGEQIQFRRRNPVSGQEQQGSIDPMLLKQIVFEWPQ
ncbi:MAG: hypothetical protein C4525_16210 [Desulfarculus sp.]|nr:MAG: hypothetical protein C4525_16210 [Desulfarculus sp.]